MTDVRQLNKKGGANKWKFQSFSERIKQIHINVASADLSFLENGEKDESYFFTSLKRVKEINITEAFVKFTKEVHPFCGPISMVLFNKQKIVDTIVKHLQDPDSEAAESILTLIPMLAKDLRQELEEFFPVFIHRLIPFINSKEPPVIESTFQCIAYLMKYLQKYVLREFTSVYDLLSPLLGKGKKQKPYVRQFIAEALSYIFPKMKSDQISLNLETIFTSLINEEEKKWIDYADGLSLLFSNIVNHINHSLHSFASVFLHHFLSTAIQCDSNRVDTVVQSTIEKIIRHVAKEKSQPLYHALIQVLPSRPEKVSGYILPSVEFYKGSKLLNRSELLDCLSSCVFSSSSFSSSFDTNFLKLLALLLSQSSLEEVTQFSPHLYKMHSSSSLLSLDQFIFFHQSLLQFNLSSYPSLISSLAINFMHSHFESIVHPKLLLFLCEAFTSTSCPFSITSSFFSNSTTFSTFVVKPCSELLLTYNATLSSRVLVTALLTILPKLNIPMDLIYPSMFALLEKSHQENSLFFSLVFQSFLNHEPKLHHFEGLHSLLKTIELKECPFLFNSITTFLLHFNDALSLSEKQCWVEKFIPFTSSLHHSIRLPICNALNHLQPECLSFALCYEIEQLPNTLDLIRGKGLLLKKLLASLDTQNDLIRRTVCKYLCSLFAVNFSMVWKLVQEMLDEFANLYPTIYLEEIFDFLSSIHRATFMTSMHEIKEGLVSIFSLNSTTIEGPYLDSFTALSSHLIHIYKVEDERIDIWNMYCLLLQSLAGKSMVEKKTNQLVPLFFEFLALEYHPLHPGLSLPFSLTEILSSAPSSTTTSWSQSKSKLIKKETSMVPSGMVLKKLTHFLTIFKNFKPHTTYGSNQLYQFYVELLGSNDVKIQKLALKCIKTYSYPWFLPYYDTLAQILDDTLFNESLLRIDLTNVDEPTFSLEHRKEIMPLLLRILHGRLRAKSKRNPSRKVKIYSFLANCEPHELQYFFNLVCPLKNLSATSIDLHILRKLKLPRALQFCSFLDDLVHHLQLKFEFLLGPSLAFLTSVACSIAIQLDQQMSTVSSNTMDLDVDVEKKTKEDVEMEGIKDEHNFVHLTSMEEQDEEDLHFEEDNHLNGCQEIEETSSNNLAPHIIQRLKKLRVLVHHRLIQLFNMDLPFESTIFLNALYSHVIIPRLPLMASENKTRLSPILLLLSSWFHMNDKFSSRADLNPLLEALITCLPGSFPIRKCVLDILFKVHEVQPEALIPLTHPIFHQCVHLIQPKGTSSTLDVRMFELVKALAIHLQPTDASVLANIAIQVLDSKMNPTIKNTVLDILLPCIPYLDTSMVETLFFATSKFYAIIEKKESRHHLVPFTQQLCTSLHLSYAGSLCEGLNRLCIKRMNVDELDYDSILNTFFAILDEGASYTYLDWVPLLFNFLFYLHSTDLSIRNSAYRALAFFIQLASENKALLLGIHRIIFPAIKLHLKNSKNDLARAEYIKVLRQCIKHINEENFINLSGLLPRDANDESAFLDNIYHLQIHRRIRTVMRLRTHLSSISIANLKTILFPILLHFLDHSDSNLVKECLLTFTDMASRLAWTAYYGILMDFFTRLKRSTSKANTKIAIRAILAWLQGFHFNLVSSTQSPMRLPSKLQKKSLRSSLLLKKPMKGKMTLSRASMVKQRTLSSKLGKSPMNADAQFHPVAVPDANFQNNAPVPSSDSVVLPVSTNLLITKNSIIMTAKEKIVVALTQKIIPFLLKYFISKKSQDDASGTSLRVPIVLGIAQLVSKLPQDKQQHQISKLLTQLCQLLRSRSKVMRFKARTTIVQIMKILGPQYLLFLIKELKTALQRGFELHVLAYTLHKVIKSIRLQSWTLEPCISLLCTIVYDDIFGQVGQEKDAEAYIKRMVELKTCKSYETIRLMAKYGSKQMLLALLATVRRVFMSEPTAQLLQKATKVLKEISIGLSTNNLISFEELIQLSISTISKTMAFEKKESIPKSWEKYEHHFVDFGLQLLRECLDSKKLKTENEAHRASLDSVLEVLPPVFASLHQPSIVNAGQALDKLIRMKLSKLHSVLPSILKKIFLLLARIQDYRHDIGQVLLKVIYACLKHCDTVPFSRPQIRTLFDLMKPELGEDQYQSVFFFIIQTILKRKLLFNEVYDIIIDISHIMVTSYSKNVQELCRATYLEFLLDYPQTQQRLADHFSWMMKNLDYEHEKGRLSLLTFLQSLIKKLPETVLIEYGQMLITGLISKLMDDSPTCRELSTTILQDLLKRYSNLHRVYSMLRVWYQKEETISLAAQVHGILISIDKNDMSLMEYLKNVLASSIKNNNKEDSTSITTLNDPWQPFYFCVLTLTKFFAKQSQVDLNLLEFISLHFTHPHHWVRLASSRCLGVFLTHSPSIDAETTSKLIDSMIQQLHSEHLDDALSTQVVKNLYSLLQHQQSLLLTSSSTSNTYVQRPIKYLSYLARRDQSINKTTLFRTSIFKVFAAIIHGFQMEHLISISHLMLGPIYRTVEDESNKGENWVALRNFCKEILELLESKLGPKEFGKAYSNVRESVVKKKHERKQALSELAVKDPTVHAQHLLARKSAKRLQKKRKITEEMALKLSFNVKRLRPNPDAKEE